MLIIKRLIKYFINLIGYQIISNKNIKYQQEKFNRYVTKILYYYNYYLSFNEHKSPSEILQFLEMKYSGPIFNDQNTLSLGTASGGDRMNVFFHDYSKEYSHYLQFLRHSKRTLNVVEVGILRGTGLAVWDEYFDNKKIYGFDYNLDNFEQNKKNLIDLGAFNTLPTLKFYDQFANNTRMLEETFGDNKIDVVIDDAHHSDQSILNTFNELHPYLNKNFVYFIEDNKTAWKKLKIQYPQYIFDYNENELTVVTKIHNI